MSDSLLDNDYFDYKLAICNEWVYLWRHLHLYRVETALNALAEDSDIAIIFTVFYTVVFPDYCSQLDYVSDV